MTLSTEPLRILDDMRNDRTANPDVDLEYGHANEHVDVVQTTFADDRVDVIAMTTFLRLRNIQDNRKHKVRDCGGDLSDLRVAVLGAGESWPPRRLWFAGYAAAFGITV